MNIQVLDRLFELTLPHTISSVGIMVSGGLDSALLLYLVAKEIHDTNSTISLNVFCVPRPTDGSNSHALAVVDYVNTEYNISSYTIRGDVDMHHSTIVYFAYRDIVSEGLSDCIFLGDTANPDTPLQGVCPTAWPNRLTDHNKDVYQPFLQYSKKYIIALIDMFDLMTLAKLTHSCTAHKHKRCDKCFQCKERAWAFECNNTDDPGIL